MEKDKKADKKAIPNCVHFLKGCCRHGFKGKTPKGNTKECRFSHPIICKPYINYGRDGCNKGKKCDFVHPVLCKHSATSKKCPNMKEGKRCWVGYHLLDTVSDTGPNTETNSGERAPENVNNPSGRNIENDNISVKDFYQR